jgi:hypothetical protein
MKITISPQDLSYIDEAITQSLKGEWFNSSQREVDAVLNDVRIFLKARGVRIEQSEPPMVTVVFPVAIKPPLKENQIAALSTAKMSP